MDTIRPTARRGDELVWHRTQVAGRPANYSVGGSGPAVVFLHGWALGNRAYRRSLRRLVSRGVRVFAPAMPSFAGTADLPPEDRSIAGYAAWVDAFLDAVGVDEPTVVIGHSFGGGVAIELAHDHPERVSYLILVNSVGGARWGGRGQSLTERPLADWVAGFGRDVLRGRDAVNLARATRDDLVTNLAKNPVGLWRVGQLARAADLTAELSRLRDRGLPVLALTSEADTIIPHTAFDALCTALGTPGEVVPGGHSWLLTNPDAFGEVMANVVEAQVAQHRATTTATRAAAIRERLAATNVPPSVADALLEGGSPLWLMSEDAAIAASDLALCHPPLVPGEVRAVARATEGSTHIRLTVVAADRPGLLADTAGVIASEGLSIITASASTWTATGLAMHAITFDPVGVFDDARWDALSARLRELRDDNACAISFVPGGAASVRVDGAGTGRAFVTVAAPDRVGLLLAICRWFADHGVSIESMSASTEAGVARDTFIVIGECDSDELARHLSVADNAGCLVFALPAATQCVRRVNARRRKPG